MIQPLPSQPPREGPVQAGDTSLEEQVVQLALSGKIAAGSRTAVRKQVQNHLPVTFKRDNQVIQRQPDGTEIVLETIAPIAYLLPSSVKILGRK